MWGVDDANEPKNFLEVLYEEASDDSNESDCYEIDDEVECKILHEHHSPPHTRDSLEATMPPHLFTSSRDRSRSPLRNVSLLPDPEWMDGKGQSEELTLECSNEEVGLEDMEDFLAPDSHPLFIVDETNANSERVGVRVRGRVNRGGPSGTVRSRGRGRRGRGVRGSGSCAGSPWRVGDPLQVVWAHDDDVPAELRQMIMDVVRIREARIQDDRHKRLHERVHIEENASESEGGPFHDAIDGSDNPLLKVDDIHFEWSSMDTFQCSEELFTPERTGSVEVHSTPYEAFRSYWDQDILDLLVDQTNMCASKISAATFQTNWYPTNFHEILCLFAFWMMLGIIRMPTVKSCFSTDPLLKTSVFRKIFTQRRYDDLTRALNFLDALPINTASTSANDSASMDRLYFLRPVIEHLNAKFQANYVLSKDISIHDSLTTKEMPSYKHYIRSKAAKLSVNSFELCESSTGYLWSFIFNTSALESTAVVRKLIDPLLNQGYRLFMDNSHNSPLLARLLKRNSTDCVGTLCPSRSDVPPIINHAKLKQGQFIARHSGDVCIMAWQDKKRITTISTCHGTDTGLSRVPSNSLSRPMPFKPQVVLDYNRSMAGVDLKDQMLEPYLLERKRCQKWYMKLFKRLLNCSIFNARILLSSCTQSHEDHLSFRCRLVDAILANHLSLCPRVRRDVPVEESSPRTLNMHWPTRVPQTPSDASTNRQSRKRCKLCFDRHQHKKTGFECESCKVPLCVEGCFKFYHVGR